MNNLDAYSTSSSSTGYEPHSHHRRGLQVQSEQMDVHHVSTEKEEMQALCMWTALCALPAMPIG